MSIDTRAYWNKRLRENFNLIGVGDISLSQNYNYWSYKITRTVLKNIFRKYLKEVKKKNVLDIGSGTGFVVDIWNNSGAKVTGIDIAEVSVDFLQKKYPHQQFLLCDIGSEYLQVDEHSIDCVSASSVLYHLVDDTALGNALRNIHRVLSANGYFIFSDNFIHKGNLKIAHQVIRSLEDYEVVLNENKFEIVARVPNYYFMNDPVDAKGNFIRHLWNLNTRLSRKNKLFDSIIWPALYPVEWVAVRMAKESPTQEIMICRAIK